MHQNPFMAGCYISIHAPPRGATGCGNEERVLPRHFNSRPSARGDGTWSKRANTPHYFNSRPSARGDACTCSRACTCADFNSRPSARGDVFGYNDLQTPAISIHAPPRGATGCNRAGYCRAYFNSRPSARGDFSRLANLSDMLFQFTPLREGRLKDATGQDTAALISIHAPPRGATKSSKRIVCCRLFQFTPLREGRR